jgi:hypothetical protein
LGHGGFTEWLSTEFPNDKRTAQRFMQVAARLPDKSDTVSSLPVATVYKLAAKSTPSDTITEVIAQLENGVDTEVVEAAIEVARQNALLEKRKENLNKKRRGRVARDKKWEKQHLAFKQEQERAKAAARQVALRLIEEIGLPTIKLVIDAVNDGNVHDALIDCCRELSPPPEDDLGAQRKRANAAKFGDDQVQQ